MDQHFSIRPDNRARLAGAQARLTANEGHLTIAARSTTELHAELLAQLG